MIGLPNDWRVYAVLALAAAGILYYTRGQLGAVGSAVNPLNHDNVFAQAANGVGAVLTDTQGEFSLGAWLWEKTHSDVVFNGG